MRNHNWKVDSYECGEGNMCHWIPLAAAGIGALGSYLGAKESNKAVEEAADKNVAAAKPEFFGPGMENLPGLLNDANSLYSKNGFAPNANPLQLLGRENQLGYAEGYLPNVIGAAQDSWMRGLNPGMDPYVPAMIQSAQNDLQQDFSRYTMPAIADKAQRVGGYGGSRQGVAQGIAAEGLLEEQGDVTTNLLSRAYQDSLRQQQAAWNQAPNMAALGFMPSQAQREVGGLYQNDATQPAQNLQGYADFLNPYIGQSNGVNANYQPAASGYDAAIGGAATGYGIGNWINNSMGGNNSSVQPQNFATTFDPNNAVGGLYGGPNF